MQLTMRFCLYLKKNSKIAYCIYFCIIFKFLPFLPHPEEFLQTVQSTAGMAVVLFIRSIMGNGDDVPVIVSEHSFFLLALYFVLSLFSLNKLSQLELHLNPFLAVCEMCL